MTARDFKEQICEELDGACNYLKKAIDYSASRPNWSSCFESMAEMEQGHATSLYKMFMELYTESEGKDAYMTQMRDAIMECFSTKMRKIEDLKSTYDIMKHEKQLENTEPEPEPESKYPADMYIPE